MEKSAATVDGGRKGGRWRVLVSVVVQLTAALPLMAFMTFIVPKFEELARELVVALPVVTALAMTLTRSVTRYAVPFWVVAILLSWMVHGWCGRKWLWRWTAGVAAILFAWFVVVVAVVIIPIMCFAPQLAVRTPAHAETTLPPPHATTNISGAVILSVNVERNRAVITGRGAPGAWLMLRVGKGYSGCTFPKNAAFTATYELPMWGNGIHVVVKDDGGGKPLLAMERGRVGPMTEQDGRLVFRKGTPAAGPDGSYLIGEFRPDHGSPSPVTVGLERSEPGRALEQVNPSPAVEADSNVESQPPVVVETFPVAGSRDVEPGEIEIRVRFSKPMTDGSWSWCNAWKDSVPELIGPPHYEPDGRTCVVKTKLEAGRTYAFWLNSEKFKNFTDQSGQPAIPYLLNFQTRQK